MSGEGYTHQARSAPGRIDIDALDQGARDAHEQAVTAVGDLAIALREDQTDDAVAVKTPDKWDDKKECAEKVDKAYEPAEIPRLKGALTTKAIDDQEYYYLQ